MSIIEKIKAIPNLYKSKPATVEEVSKSEERLTLKFSAEFIDYLMYFGSISFYGTEWMGLNTDEFCDVVATTLEARQLYDNFPTDKYIIEDLHFDDILILSDSNGKIYEWTPTSEKLMHDSLLDYLEECAHRAG